MDIRKDWKIMLFGSIYCVVEAVIVVEIFKYFGWM